MSGSSAGTTDTTQKTRVTVTPSKDSMSVTVVLKQPAIGEPPITVKEITEALKQREIVHEVDQEAIKEAVEGRKYSNPIVVAKGTPPKKGQNSQITYHFDTNANHKPQEDDDGRIDYKNINFIKNIEKGGLLASKEPPTLCVQGTNIYGKTIKGPDGRDIPFKHGTNTEVSADGKQLLATASGAIVYRYGTIAVNDVMVIQGDVDFKVGNLDCRGSVKVTGAIKAGFEIKIDGDLEVSGNVEDANIEVGGHIMVKGGFFGKGEGIMRAGGDVVVKFAEGQRIESGGNIEIGGEIINCQVVAGGNVHVKGRKGKIVGGEVKAHKEIRAGVLGSSAGTATVLAVAYDAELMGRYTANIKETERLQADGAKIKDVMVKLYRMQMDGKLSAEQEAALAKLEKFNKDLPQNLENLAGEKVDIEDQLARLEGARIVAEEKIYPGVKAQFGLVYREILEEVDRCMLTQESNKILFSDLKED
ncbi:MAG: DUF342 domain-containing protein [candidate division Zixibacteria bacterium]|nr:DUF342 domain-containing protein [candidate division Zixibacteria bacterium]